MRKIIFVNLFIILTTVAAIAQDEVVKVPDNVKPFIDSGRIPIALETGDLNADGRKDFILVISEVVSEEKKYEEGSGERSVLILVRDASGALSLAGRNDVVAMCKVCGGAMGDPFAGVTISATRFTVMNYGGSASRWSYEYTFGYSRRDRNWQLVKVEESSFHALDPERTKKFHRYTPPRDFGLITFADFDPDSFKGKGKK